MIRPWWWQWSKPADERPVEIGEPGPGLVLGPVEYDSDGDPVRWAWMTPEVAQQWARPTIRRL